MDEAVRHVLAGDPRIAYALVFGSHATGRSTLHSALDIAIGSSSGRGFDRRTVGEFVSRLESATGRTVDIVILDDAPPALAYRIFRDGRVIVDSDRRGLARREAMAILLYLDFEPVERMGAQAILEEAADGR